MCGITGFIDTGQDKNGDALSALASAMNDTLAHRGPDGEGVWADPENGVALAQRRLAIVDLSETGRQPMHSATGRYVIVFNGEIYNFLTLKARLEDKGHAFRGTSDTEVLLSAVEEWGLKDALREVNGMFAFALWDQKERLLYLARDRMGKKPLYYGWSGKSFLFGSELKAFRAHPDFVPEIDRNALAVYTRHNYIPVPWSIYKGIYKLPPASFMAFSAETGRETPPEVYWDLRKVAEDGCRDPFEGSFEEAVEELESVLSAAVVERMIADVPLGAFLSGGIDSSLIAALMQKHASAPVKTFSIGFEKAGYDEAPHAKKIAEHLGTDHTEYYVSAEEARAVIPDLPAIFDEPFADPSQIPTFHVSRLARQDVTVALSGDGGDEAFAGYDRYHRTQKLAGLLYKMPAPVRSLAGQVLGTIPVPGRLKRLSDVLLHAGSEHELYRMVMSYWSHPEHLVLSGVEPPVAMSETDMPDLGSFMNTAMYRDMRAYLPDDVLVKVDRASMAVSLEARAPLLDYRVIEYAWRVPLSMKVKGGEGKALLKALLERYVPRHLFERPKQGFGIPHGQWICGPLKDWAETLLEETRLKQEGFFNPELVRRKWEEHSSGRRDWSYHLWSILMFQAWHEHWSRQ